MTEPPAYQTLTYEVTGRVARVTFNRADQGNSITADTPVELADAVERADLDQRVHVILVSGRGKGFCGGYDLSISAEGMTNGGAAGISVGAKGTVLDPVVQMTNHLPGRTWDPMVDYAMMSRFNRGFASLLCANKPTVVKIHGFCVAGGTDIALYADQVIAAADAKIGYPPTRVWGVPAAGMWAHRLGDQRAKRLLFTGDCLSGTEAAEWGLVVEAPPAEELDERTEVLVQRIARLPVNQLMMVKLAMNSALLAQGVQNSGMISTVFDGISRHTQEGYAFQQRAAEAGFRQAVRERDDPFGDAGRSTFKG
ncbi:MAG: crotonase/enoyl-CoA hydratase family protein [Haloechinothrix sp.]